MLILYLRRLTGLHRSLKADIHLGLSLAFIGGAINVGGFVVVYQYTSHMTGIVSSIADGIVLGDLRFALAALGSLLCFTLGAACTELMVNWARGRRLRSEYALPLVFEAVLLLVFGFAGPELHEHMGLFVSCTVMLLCFMMGLQNAIITRISNAVIRTTHVTGIVTDIGIEFGKMLFWNRGIGKEDEIYVRANRGKLVLLVNLLLMFFLGGVAGVFCFQRIGYLTTVFLAAILLLLAIVPVVDDFRIRWRRRGHF
ncbi:MAG: DUF1275 domain-containing protein [Alistipes senegalensis]|nr:DUF1275 domain-containing protein [Oxalobacter formigenes]MCM1281360.1 DUF1275 domain-containing protein [Alistipes senegalensis]